MISHGGQIRKTHVLTKREAAWKPESFKGYFSIPEEEKAWVPWREPSMPWRENRMNVETLTLADHTVRDRQKRHVASCSHNKSKAKAKLHPKKAVARTWKISFAGQVKTQLKAVRCFHSFGCFNLIFRMQLEQCNFYVVFFWFVELQIRSIATALPSRKARTKMTKRKKI